MTRFIILFLLTFYLSAPYLESQSSPVQVVIKRPRKVQKYPIARDVHTYYDLITHSNVFVDKSLLIKDILENEIIAILITCPAGWGKSINLDMLRRFFEMEIGEEGEPFNPRTSSSYQLFNDGEITWSDKINHRLKTPLLISQHQDLINTHLGKYPVVYINMTRIFGRTHQEINNNIKEMLREAFTAHKYMLKILAALITDESETRTQRRKAYRSYEKFKLFVDGKQDNVTHISYSVKFLTSVLTNHFQQNTVVLIDDYDAALRTVMNADQVNIPEFVEILHVCMAIIRYATKNNVFLKRAVLVGRLQFGKGSHMTPCSVIEYNYAHNNLYYQYFGFHQAEVDLLFDYFVIPAELRDQAKRWYDGFESGFHNISSHVYSPQSIIEMVAVKQTQNFLSSRNEIQLVSGAIRIKSLRYTFESLINERNVTFPFDRLFLTRYDMVHFIEIQAGNITLMRCTSMESLIGYLVSIGYLTLTNHRSSEGFTKKILEVKIPNKEVTTDLIEKLSKVYLHEFPVPLDIIDNLANKLADFVLNDSFISYDLENAFNAVIKDLPVFSVFHTPNGTSYTANRSYMNSLLTYILIRIRILHRFHARVVDEYLKPTVVMYKGNRGATIKIRHNSKSRTTLTAEGAKINKFRGNFIGIEQIQTIKYITCDIYADKIVVINALVDGRDYDDYGTMT